MDCKEHELKKSDYYFNLPKELIAQTPLEKRDSSRLLVLNRESGAINHKHFTDIEEYIQPGDCLVLNNSRVIPARLMGTIEGKTTPVEVVLLTDHGDQVWECLTRPGKKTRVGARVSFGDGLLTGTVERIEEEGGNRFIKFDYEGVFLELLDKLGTIPLPPYIKTKLDDPERYQTVYCKTPGSAAAPTAGLHFTKELLNRLIAKGVKIAYLTLHVGLGTFRPVKTENILEHVMHSEFYVLDKENADKINETRVAGGKIFAVGTTATRTLETIAGEDGTVKAKSGWTDIFIYPGYHFKAIDCLITNFHLPESTLVMLVSALAGREHILNAYKEAIEKRYRFFSFGDAMLIYKE